MSTLMPRIIKAAQFLGIPQEEFSEKLKEQGITDDDLGREILDADFTTLESIINILNKFVSSETPDIRVTAAANALKTSDKAHVPTTSVPAPDVTVTTVLAALQANKRPSEMKDLELLEAYMKDRDPEVEQELARRANNRRFIVLVPGKYEPGKEVIDVEKSLQQLKRARKMEISSFDSFNGIVLQIYRITELNPEDRKTEICPFCGQALSQGGYCVKCELDFGGIGMDERAFLKLVTSKSTFKADSFSDRRAAFASAKAGIEDLKKTWPSVVQEFEEKKLTNTLPQLVFIKPTPSTKIADPFAVNRSY